jgi:hypothetical protein
VYLVKIDIVVKRYKVSQLGGSEPSDCVSTDGKENESHVEFKGLSRALGCRETITHDFEGILLRVLIELPCEQPNHDHYPQGQNPESSPILLQVVKEVCTPPSY